MSKSIAPADRRNSGDILQQKKILETEHMVEAETARAVHNAMIAEQATRDVTDNDIGPRTGTATFVCVECLKIAPIDRPAARYLNGLLRHYRTRTVIEN